MIAWIKAGIASLIDNIDKEIKEIENIQIIHISVYREAYKELLQCAKYELRLSYLRLKREMFKALLPKK